MSKAASTAPDVAHQRISIARLHGEACIDCGAVHQRLFPAGTLRTMTERGARVWSVVTCTLHQARGGAR
ncbi:hypothetical protein GCM10027091_35080 [Streptomyces daliensis]